MGAMRLLLLASGLQGAVSPAPGIPQPPGAVPCPPHISRQARARPGQRGGCATGPGALSTPLPAPSHRAPVFWEGTGAQIPPFYQMASVLADGKPLRMPDWCHQTPPKNPQQLQNSPPLDESPISQERRSEDSPGLLQGLFCAVWVLCFTPRPRTASPGCWRDSALSGPRPRSSAGWYNHTGLHLVFISVLPVCNYHLPRRVCRC